MLDLPGCMGEYFYIFKEKYRKPFQRVEKWGKSFTANFMSQHNIE